MPSAPWVSVPGVGDVLPRESEGVGEAEGEPRARCCSRASWRRRSPFLLEARIEERARLRLLPAGTAMALAAAAAWWGATFLLVGGFLVVVGREGWADPARLVEGPGVFALGVLEGPIID